MLVNTRHKRTVKLTQAQYLSIRKPLPVRHIACEPRESTSVVSQYSQIQSKGQQWQRN